MVKIKSSVNVDKIIHHVYLEIEDLIKNESYYNRIKNSILRKISPEGIIDEKRINKLINDCKIIFNKLQKIDEVLPLELYNFFNEILELIDYNPKFNSPGEIKLIRDIGPKIKKFQNRITLINHKNNKSASFDKPYESFFKKLSSDSKVFSWIHDDELKKMSYHKLIEEIEYSDFENINWEELTGIIKAFLRITENEIDSLSITERRKLHELKEIKRMLISSNKVKHFPFVKNAVQQIEELEQEFGIELSEGILKNKHLNEIEHILIDYKPKHKQKPEIAYHTVFTVFIQYAILNKYLLGKKGKNIDMADKPVGPFFDNLVLPLKKLLIKNNVKPIEGATVLEFDLKTMMTGPISNYEVDEYRHKNNITDNWYRFKGPVNLKRCLTSKSLKEVRRIEKKMFS